MQKWTSDEEKEKNGNAKVEDDEEEEFKIEDGSNAILYYFEKGFHNTDALQMGTDKDKQNEFVPSSLREELKDYDDKENGDNDSYVFVT